jgi:hypothetical protein
MDEHAEARLAPPHDARGRIAVGGLRLRRHIRRRHGGRGPACRRREQQPGAGGEDRPAASVGGKHRHCLSLLNIFAAFSVPHSLPAMTKFTIALNEMCHGHPYTPEYTININILISAIQFRQLH